jgi:ubiquitin carboxyl-terminal hydrolase 5/13
LEQNLKFDFSMTTADGKDMEPVFGPGLTGMKNLGNSCYLASVMQFLFSVPSFQEYYFGNHYEHILMCQESPPDCFRCQMGKLADGLLSGRYSVENGSQFNGVSPSMVKHIVGKNHQEFQTMRQQVRTIKKGRSRIPSACSQSDPAKRENLWLQSRKCF